MIILKGNTKSRGQEDISVLGLFRAKVITTNVMKNISNKFHQRTLITIGGFHAISGDTNNNGEMNKCWWTNKTS